MEPIGANPVCVALRALLVIFSVCGAAHAQADEVAALDRRAGELLRAGKTAEAIPLVKRSLELREKALPAGHPNIADTLNNLASLYNAQGRLKEAEPLYKRALEMREKALPAGHPDIASSLNSLAVLYQAQGRLAEAEPLYTRALEMR